MSVVLMSAQAARRAPSLSPQADVRRALRNARRAGRPVRVAVVGGGVAGISTALELLAEGVSVVIIEDRDVSTTVSWIAAGLVEPVAGTLDPEGMARETRAFTRSMAVWRDRAAKAPTLVTARRVVRYGARSRAPLPWADVVEEFRVLGGHELHPLYAGGDAATFGTYVVETSRWLTAMRARLGYAGAQFVRGHVTSLDAVPGLVGPVDGIVNASGLGAARLADDATLYRGDGHVIRLAPVEGVDTVFMDETRAPEVVANDPFAVNMLYVIPRRYDIVVGGTLWDNADVTSAPQPIDGMAQHLLALAARVEPRLRHAQMRGYHVGARPRRHAGVRVELDRSGQVPVVHLYGQGGSGWTLAPALAEQAVRLLGDAVWAAESGVAEG